MSYMGMEKKTRERLLAFMFILNYALVCSNANISFVVNLLGSVSNPLMLNVFPGYLYYRYRRDNKP